MNKPHLIEVLVRLDPSKEISKGLCTPDQMRLFLKIHRTKVELKEEVLKVLSKKQKNK